MKKVFKRMAAVLTAVVLLAGVGAPQLHAAEQPAEGRAIVVTGRGKVKVKPDIAIITLGVQTDNADAKAAQAENSAKMTKVINQMKALGIAETDIQTANYYMYPKYDYNNNNEIIGYTINYNISVTLRDIAKTGEIMDAGVAAGANSANNIQFSIADTSPHYEKALNAAISNASEKGGVIAAAIGATVSGPSKIVELETYNAPMAESAVAKDIAGGSGMPIQVGELEVTAAVEVTFAY